VRGGVSLAPNFSENQRGNSPSGIALAALSHVQAVEANYRGVLSEDRFLKGDKSYARLKSDSERIVTILERGGVQARLPRDITDLTLVTGVAEIADSYRNTNVIPVIASRNRRQMMYDLQYFVCNIIKYPVRYAVLTFGQRRELYSDLRGDAQAFHRKISKVAHWAKTEYGVYFIFRGDELPFDETLTFHLHANVLYWQTRPMSAARWGRFIREMGAKLGARWKDNGPLKDVAEVVKYLSKGDDLSLLADFACMVPQWADREVPQAELIETVAARIAHKRSEALRRRVSVDECFGAAISVVREGVEFFRRAAAEGKPHPLVWLFHQLHGLHLVQPSGDFQSSRNSWDLDSKRVHLHTGDDGSKYLRLKEKNSVPKSRLDRNEPLTDEEKEIAADKAMLRKLEEVENQILCVTMPMPRACPWPEEVVKVRNFNPNPKTETGAHNLFRIQVLQEKARRRWERAGSPDPAYALSVAAAIRAEAGRGDPASAGGSWSSRSDGPSGGEAAAPYRSHNNDNCPDQNSPCRLQRRSDGSMIDVDTRQIVFRPPTVDEIFLALDVDGAIARAAMVAPASARPHFISDPIGVPPDQRSLRWQIENWGKYVSEWDCSDEIDIWYSEKYIQDDEKNFSVVGCADGLCDIPF
jgi:hypothetical protein